MYLFKHFTNFSFLDPNPDPNPLIGLYLSGSTTVAGTYTNAPLYITNI
jgi:hypothetical protein